MKKLLSICFLSILLGLLSFSTRAQSSCGFVIKNLQPDTIFGVVQMAPDGELPLEHTLGSGVFINPQNPYDYYGNANVGATELYEVFLCNTCGLDAKTKVSLDWILQRQNENGEWVNVNDNLSNYVDFDIYTLYRELNNQGVCNRITWLGGRVPNGFGCCEQAVAPDMFHGITCNTPSNYPGALPVGQGTPYSVMNQLGELIPAMGMTPIYTEALDYFYLDFFSQTRTLIQLKWKQAGNYRLIVNLRERVGGTAWNNLTWNDNETTDFIGGHQSCCGQILKSDTLTYPIFGELSKEVCENEHFVFGRPPYDFSVTMADTNVVFGDTLNSGACEIFDVDSIYRLHFFVRHTPVLQPVNYETCECPNFGPDSLVALVQMDNTEISETSDHYLLWYHWKNAGDGDPEIPGTQPGYGWFKSLPTIDNTPGVHVYPVRQRNIYNNFNEELICDGEPVNVTITVKAMQVPTVPAAADICLEVIDSDFVQTVTAQHDQDCASTTRWYKTVTTAFHNNKTQYLRDLVYTGDVFPIQLIDYVPATNIDKTVKFYAVSYDETRDCESQTFATYTIYIHQTPEIHKVTIPAAVNCPGATVTMSAEVTTGQTEAPYNFKWNGDVTTVDNIPFVEDSLYTVGTMVASNIIYNYPFSNEAKYNYTQQIYEASEIGGAGEITKIAFATAGSGTISKNNVKIYLGTTTESTFNNSNKQWLDAGTLVYDGTVNFTATGWQEIELQHPFVYNGTDNLIVTVDDQSGTFGGSRAFYRNSKTHGAQRYYGSTPKTNTTLPKEVNYYRNSIQFLMESAGYPSQDGTSTAQFQLSAQCGASYMTTVYAIDANGCVSQPDTFNYTGNDTEAPVITIADPAALVTTQDACHVTAPAAYTTVADLAQIGVTATDNCALNPAVTHADVTYTGTCEDTLVRTYTIADMCGNTSTFNQTFISHDNQAPYFEFPQGAFPYVRLYPVPAGHDCQYNSPDSMDFVNAVAAHVRDNCTDSATLMQSVTFHWENTTVTPINDVNIFRTKNHLTVAAVITDNCGNTADSLIIYLDKPDSIWIDQQITNLTTICQGASSTLTFNPALVHGDDHFGLFEPLTYEWSVLNGKAATFSDPHALTTTVTPQGYGDYIFVVTVTDTNECTAVSGYYKLTVNPYPDVKIVAIPHDGSATPFCPTYGNVAMQVVDKTSEQIVPGLNYVWSGENVDATATTASGTLSIQPSKCTHDYVANVVATDAAGCACNASITIHAADNEAPVLADGSLRDTILEYQTGCNLKVPDFAPMMVGNVSDNCFSYATGDITYVQTPAAGTTITDAMWNEGNLVVTVKLTDACNNESTYTVNAIKPLTEPKLQIAASDDYVCENDQVYVLNGITITSVVTDGVAPFSYNWTEGASTTTISTDPNYNFYKPNGTYQFNLEVTDANGCTANASVDVTIYYMGDDFPTRVWANTLCQGFDGALAVDTVPYGYSFIFQENGIPVLKSQDVPSHAATDWNTVLFSPCAPGKWPLTIITPDGCEHVDTILIPNTPTGTPVATATPHNVTNCTNNNGWIEVTMQTGYTYYFIDGTDTTLITTPIVNGLSASTYSVFRVDNATGCPSPAVSYTLGDDSEGPAVTFDQNPGVNTSCSAVTFNGSFKLMTGDKALHYVVTFESNTIYDGDLAANDVHTLTGLKEGTYSIVATDPTTGCSTPGQVTIQKVVTPPSVSVTPHANTYCDLTMGADGYITVTVADGTTYTIVDPMGVTVDPANYNKLAEGTYTVNVVDALSCENSAQAVIGVNPLIPTVTASTTDNMSCVAGNANGSVTVNITNAAVGGSYLLWSKNAAGEWNTTPVVKTGNVFTGLPNGDYRYQVISNKGCVSAYGYASVGQYILNTMTFNNTPNYMCTGANGTITVTAPVNDASHTYTYTCGSVTNTTGIFTGLAEGSYNVTALETESGCDITRSTTVVKNSYTVTKASVLTKNNKCVAPFNGTATINASSTNPNAELTYSIDGTNFQTSNEFTGLAAGDYVATIKDANVNCEYTLNFTIETQANDLTITGTTTKNDACDANLYNGTLTVAATSTTWENPSYLYKFQDGAYATENTWSGLGQGSYTVTVKETTSGCTASVTKTVEYQANDLAITGSTTENHGCTPALYDGTMTVQASSTTWTNPSYVFSRDNGATYATTSSWDNLGTGFYTVYVKEVTSGCTANATFEVVSDGCIPTIIDTAINHNLNPNHWHFCLGTENASLRINATLPDGCDNQGFTYNWMIDCHSQTGEGYIIPVATNEVHCCTYTVTVTSNATGCTAVKPIYVCIDGIDNIQFQINHSDFNANPKVTYICENEPINIGIRKDNWEHATWTNYHHTAAGDDPEYNFDMPANSITPPGLMRSFCVEVVDYNGCRNQGVISVVTWPVPEVTVDINECLTYTTPSTYGRTGVTFNYDPAVTYPVTHTDVLTGASVNGCDSIVTYSITLRGVPVMSADVVADPFCEQEGKTLADYENQFTVVWNGEDGDVVWIADEGGANFTKVTNMAGVTDGLYVITDAGNNKAMSSAKLNNTQAQDAVNINLTDPTAATLWTITKNTDNTYAIYNAATGMYAAGLNNAAGIELTTDKDAPNAKWNISFNGANVRIENDQYSGRYLKYNSNNPRFASYNFSSGNTNWLSLYKGEQVYKTVPSTTPLTQNYVNNFNIKRVASNTCGADTANIQFTINQAPHFTADVADLSTTTFCPGNTLTLNVPSYVSNHYGNTTINVLTKNAAGETEVLIDNFLGTAYTKTLAYSDNGLQIGFQVVNGCGEDATSFATVVMNNVPQGTVNAGAICQDEQLGLAYTITNASEILDVVTAAPFIKMPSETTFSPFDPTTVLDFSYNGAQLYYTFTNACGTSNSPTITITVNPKPVLTVATVPADLCINEAATAIAAGVVNVQYATTQGWLYTAVGAAAPVAANVDADDLITDVNALVTAVAAMPSASLYYYVANNCGSAVKTVGDVRILQALTMTITGSPALVCHGATLNDVLGEVDVVLNPGNYLPSEVDVDFYAGANHLYATTVVSDYITSGQYITAVYHHMTGVHACGQASRTITVNFKSNTYTAPTYQAACDGAHLEDFIATEPSYTGNDPATGHWEVYDNVYFHTVDPATYVVDYTTFNTVKYVWTTACGETEETTPELLTINRKPEITSLATGLTTCAGGTVNEADANLTVAYHGNASAYTTKWTVDGQPFDFSTPLTTAYDGKYLVATIDDEGAACGSTADSLVLHVNPNPTPTISGPAKACDGDNITFTAPTGYASYSFTLTGNYSGMVESGNAVSAYVHADGVEFVTAHVTVTDANGCSGTSAESDPVRVTDRPEFIFFNADGSENAEHVYTSTTGTGLDYGWMINTGCAVDDKLVYVEFDYYFNGQKIEDNDAIGQYLLTQIQTDVYGVTHPYVTSLTFAWLNGDHSQNANTSLFNYSIANPTTATAGNHFPNTNLGLSTSNVYDDLWMHFIGDRQVNVNIVPFRLHGEYKVVYRLYSTTHEDNFENLYYEDSHHMDDNYYDQTLYLGGQNAFTNNPTLTLLISDSILVNVTGEDILPSTTPVEEVTLMPEVAPQLSMEEATIVPEMEVWPNPAPAVTTTLKARVHNLSGNATVTLMTLAGKQVYNGDIYIDNDNYYFEFNVNSLSVGSYIMTVRTATDVITKKVIVTSLAR